jgi:hypothetical protein
VALMRETNSYARFYGEEEPYTVECIDALAAEAAAEDAENERTWAEREAATREANRARLAGRAEAWKAGHHVYIGGHPDTFLRATVDRFTDGLEVETSRGAHVPLAAAERLYRSLHANIDVTGERVGVYTFGGQDDAGITIGCHFIAWSEVERFAATMGWTTGASAPVEQAVSA